MLKSINNFNKDGLKKESWKEVKLKDVCDIDLNSLSEKTNAFYKFKYIDLSSVNKGKIDFPKYYIEFNKAPSRARRIIKKNDIIISTVRPNLKGFAFIDFNCDNFICSTGFAVLTVKKNILSKYVYQIIYSKNIEIQINNMLVGSNYPAINASDILSLKFLLPPLEEQEKIVSILSKQDEVIEKLEKLIELKVRQKKGLMQRLLSGKLRLKGFSGEWKENIMQSIILIFKKTKHNSSDGKNNGKYPFFINNSESFLKFLDEFDYDDECIIANTGGNAFFDYYNGKFSASSDCFVFSSKINTLFLYYFLKSIEKTVNIVGFAGSGIKHLNKKWFYKLKILIPPTIEEQSAIASILSKCDEEIELLKKNLGLYRGQKKWLMEKLLSGEIRV